jgi:hypothetical protein
LSKESTPMKDVGIAVNKTTIPILRWAIKWNGETSPALPLILFQQWYWKMHGNKPESQFVKRINVREWFLYHSRQDHDPSYQLNAEQSNEMARRHPSPPWFYFRQQYWKMPSNIPESCFAKRVNTREGCW